VGLKPEGNWHRKKIETAVPNEAYVHQHFDWGNVFGYHWHFVCVSVNVTYYGGIEIKTELKLCRRVCVRACVRACVCVCLFLRTDEDIKNVYKIFVRKRDLVKKKVRNICKCVRTHNILQFSPPVHREFRTRWCFSFWCVHLPLQLTPWEYSSATSSSSAITFVYLSLADRNK
jgi:hypothetical protein